MARVVIQNLTKVFTGPNGQSIEAVRDASLEVQDKELLVVVGPSGCGKSTTLRLIAGLEHATRGSISVDGRLMNGVSPKERDIAMVFQQGALYPHMTVAENLAFGLKLRHCPKAEIAKRIAEAAALLELNSCLDRLPGTLSGGQRQRVALGRAIVRQPKVFLLDEPLSHLDAPMRLQMRAEIAKLQRRLAATMIYVTHDQVEAMTLGNRIAVMDQGQIQQVAQPMNLYRHPANLFVARFMGSPPMNFFRGTLAQKGDALFFIGQLAAGAAAANGSLSVRVDDQMAARLGSYLGKKVILGLRPEHITVQRSRGDGLPEQAVEAVVEVVEPLGPETFLHLKSGKHSFVARIDPADNVAVNQKALLFLEMSQAHFFDPATCLAII